MSTLLTMDTLFPGAQTEGVLIWFGIMGLILVGSMVKLFGSQWDDWLDERLGRGSIKDFWLLRRMERDAKADRH